VSTIAHAHIVGGASDPCRSRLHDLRWWTAGRKGDDPEADAVDFAVEYSVRCAPIAV